MNIVFVGGGNAAKELLEIFIGDKLVNLVAVIDLNADAPGMQRARELNIHTTSDMDSQIRRNDVKVILEVTGLERVRKRIIELMREDQDIITADAARMMYSLMCKQATDKNTNIADEIGKLSNHLEGVIENIDQTALEIKKILNISQIITLNTQIEAAHIGDKGRTFRVIGERLQDMFEDIKSALNSINGSSMEGHNSLRLLLETERGLREMETKNIRKESNGHAQEVSNKVFSKAAI